MEDHEKKDAIRAMEAYAFSAATLISAAHKLAIKLDPELQGTVSLASQAVLNVRRALDKIGRK